MLAGNVYYTFLGSAACPPENRTDVTALPYGPSVPHMFHRRLRDHVARSS